MTSLAVSPSWLHSHLADPLVVVIDCRFSLMQPEQGQHQYQQGHIPGAYYLDLNQDLSSPVKQHGGRHPLPDVAQLATRLSQMGIHSHPPAGPTLVVVYDDSRFAFAARLWWLLRYMGHDRVAVLDGGFSAWQGADYPLSSEAPPEREGLFVPDVRADWVVDRAQVQRSQQDAHTVLIDSREPERYRGEREPIDPIAGHIPGALNYPWQTVTTDQGFLRPAEEQQQRWSSLPDSQNLIVYCGSGVTACVNLLSLELAGLPGGRLYAGSWSDWCSYLTTPAKDD